MAVDPVVATPLATVIAVGNGDDGQSDWGPNDGERRKAKPRIQSVARAVDVIMSVAQSERGLTSKELTERLQVSRQGTYHLIHTLVSAGLLTRSEDDRYVLGLRVGTLASAFERQISVSEQLAPHVRSLARESGETAYAAGWRHGEIVILTVARGTNAVQAVELTPGTARDAHARASGKLLLSRLSNEDLVDYLRYHPMRRRTRTTITNRRELNEDIRKITEQGFSVDREEYAEGLCCIAMPYDGEASPFVVGLSIPTSRFSDDDVPQYLALVRSLTWRPT
jgi:IclR family acetate operon transcriptional repressor